MPIDSSFRLRDSLVELLGNHVDLLLQRAVVLHQVLDRERLVGEAHVHHGRRMTFRRRQVDEAAFAQQVDLAAVAQRELLDESRVVRFDDDIFSSAGMSISTLKWPELEMIAPSFIASKCSLRSTLLLPVTVQKTSPIFAASSMLITRKPSITASIAFVGSISVTMTSAPRSARAAGQSAAAPAVAGDHELRARQQEVGGAHDAVDGRLPGAVAVVEQVLGVGVVHRDDGIAQHALLRHGAQADDAGGGLFRAGDHAVENVGALGERDGDQVSAVIHRDVRLVVERRHDVRVVGVVVLALDGIHRDVVVAHQAGGDVVLGGERVGGAEHDIGAAIAQGDGRGWRFRP